MKRICNTTGLKVKYLPCTNTQPSRWKLTQTNFNKSIIISDIGQFTPIEFFCERLEQIEEIENFSLLVDNTQKDFYLFVLNFKNFSFENILNHFKK